MTDEPLRDLIEALDACRSIPDVAEPVKLTQAQLDCIPRGPAPHPWAPDALAAHFVGIPVELVDTIEKSTPYKLALRKAIEETFVNPRRSGGEANSDGH